MGSTSPDGDLPYWQVNVPPSEREAECPDFLRDLSDKDRGIVGTRDADFRPDSWAVLRRKIETNRLDLLRRVPSVLRLYLAYNRKIARQHGSVMAFVLSQRLRWEPPIVARGRPFEFPEDDVKILWNDWPYGVDDRVVHLVVWTKFPFEEDPITGDLTDAARAEIEEFVVKTFGQNMPRDRYLWFKNWASLKSIQAVEHFHVMLYDPDPELVNTLTHGDIPLSERVKRQGLGDV